MDSRPLFIQQSNYKFSARNEVVGGTIRLICPSFDLFCSFDDLITSFSGRVTLLCGYAHLSTRAPARFRSYVICGTPASRLTQWEGYSGNEMSEVSLTVRRSTAVNLHSMIIKCAIWENICVTLLLLIYVHYDRNLQTIF